MDTIYYSPKIIERIRNRVQSHIQDSGTSGLEQMPLILSIQELMGVLGLGRDSTVFLVKSGAIKCFYVGRKMKIPRSAVFEFLNK